jgi:RNA polymerase sigma factor (sigma-70 family)
MTESEDLLIGAIYRAQLKVRGWICQQIGSDQADDVLAECFLAAVEAVRHGAEIRDPEGYAIGIVRKRVCQTIGEIQKARRLRYNGQMPDVADRRLTPEEELAKKERRWRLRAVVDEVPQPLNREILWRFYLDEQTNHEICEALMLTEAQLRLRKNRAKSKLRNFPSAA